ncbi:MAG TPA: hypothetical protein PLH34_08625 [Bacillota bacterium]|nr:hypothetical protein [Bacillota bacterium]
MGYAKSVVNPQVLGFEGRAFAKPQGSVMVGLTEWQAEHQLDST